jgi:phosphoesterase RecJ-like protein
MGEVVRGTKGKKLVVDHHVSEDEMGAIAFKNTSAEATGRLVMEAADQLGVELTPSMAKPLFAAIATDTGWFRFGSADASTYRHAAKLIDSGARPDEIYGSLYEQDKLGRIRLRGMVLERIHTEMDGDLGYTYIGRDDFARLGALPSDTEDLVNMVLAVQGIKVAAIFIQQIDGGFKISFRSRCHVDCSELASKFGGGGHRAAAGAFVDGELDEVKSVVLDAVREAMR